MQKSYLQQQQSDARAAAVPSTLPEQILRACCYEQRTVLCTLEATQPVSVDKVPFSEIEHCVLFRPAQEAQKIFSARVPMDAESIRTRLTGFGMEPLTNVDPNADNFVGAAIIHTRAAQIGTLLRLEPNRQAKVGFVTFSYKRIRFNFQMYRLTLRSSREQTAKHLCDILHEMF